MVARHYRVALITLVILGVLIGVIALFVEPQSFPKELVKVPTSKAQPQLQVSYTSAFVLAPDGSLWVCGTELSFVTRPTDSFQRVGEGKDWKQIAHKFNLAAALKNDGSLWTWSNIHVAQQGSVPQPSNSVAGAREPTQLGRDNDWAHIAAGASHALALKRDGSLWAWGQNDRGQVGDGTRENQKEPKLIRGGVWKAISASHFNGYALKSDGSIWGWGIGMSTRDRESDSLEPRPIDDGTNWVAIVAGDYHLVAMKSDGTLWLLGHNANIAAPDFAARGASNFVQVGTDTNWVACISGANSFLARKRDGSWWSCGENNRGQLGLRNDFDVKHPTALPVVFEPWALDAGGTRTLLLTGDGALWLWGKPLGPEEGGLGARLRKMINALGKSIGVGRVIRDPPVHRPDPVKIWEVPER